MIYNYKELLNKLGNEYQITKAVREKKIYKIEKGLYSESKFPNELEIITKKYPKAIFTLDCAFYFYDLTDVIPQKYQLAISEKDRKIIDKRIDLSFMTESFLEIGKTTLETHNTIINTYDRERLLIELIRNKNRLAPDFYKEVLNNYREIVHDLEERKIEEYLKSFKNASSIFKAIRNDVY